VKRRRSFGHVRKLPSGRYQASYVQGNDRILAKRTFPTRLAAGDWLTGIEADLLRGQWVDPRQAQITLKDYAGQWLATKTGLEARTRELYGHLLEHHVDDVLGDTRLSDLKPSQVRAWYSDLASKHPSTAAKAYRLLSSILKTAVGDEVLTRSPCTIRGAGTEPAREWVIVTEAEAQKIADAMPAHLRAVVILAAWCQLRRAELLGLQWQDVNLRTGTLTIQHTRTPTMAGHVLEKAPKSAAGRRTVAMPQIALEALKQRKTAGSGASGGDLVFRGAQGGALLPQVLHTSLRRAVRKTGLSESIRLHDLRHSGLTWFGQAGATLAELMYRGGHSTPAAALRYQHAAIERDRQLAAKLGRNRTTIARTPKTPKP
jgi:integrase